jgi:hypothetical protein
MVDQDLIIDKMPYNHKTKHISYEGIEADIDEGIADLILLLWQKNISTTMSCENNVPESYVWIEFASVFEAEKFIDKIRPEFSQDICSLYNRIMLDWASTADSQTKYWIYSIKPRNINAGYIEDEGGKGALPIITGRMASHFEVGIRFPQSDLQEIYDRIKGKNKNVKE